MGEPLRAYGDPALGAFDLDFFDSGERRRTALGSGWSVRFEDVPPVRGFRWNKGDRSFAGWYYAVTTGDHVGYGSWLERDRLILLDFARTWWGSPHSRSGCTGARSQRSGGTRLTTSYGWPTDAPAWSIVRAEDDVDERTAEAFAATERACSAVGWERCGPGHYALTSAGPC
ncbi:hypothetical protein [Streptomyces sp. NPDC056937]|uniref:hypothetical protein n=1 Tax=Streptomyces sp. NPDC056937 TaxID=3345969 RepID=UPI00362CDA56